MTNDNRSGLQVPAERPDKQAAARDPKSNAEDRPGFVERIESSPDLRCVPRLQRAHIFQRVSE